VAIALEGTTTGSTTSAASFTLTSWTPLADELVLLAVAARDESITVTASGNGLTFVEVADVDNVQGQCGITVLRAMESSGVTTGQITVTMTGNSKPAFAVASRFSGVDTSGSEGSGAVEATATDTGPDPDNDDVKISVTTVTDNAWAWAAATHRSGTLDSPPDTGEVTISLNNTAGSGGDITSCSTWYQVVPTAGATQLGTDNDLDSARDWCAAAISIKPAGQTIGLDELTLAGSVETLNVEVTGDRTIPLDSLTLAGSAESINVAYELPEEDAVILELPPSSVQSDQSISIHVSQPLARGGNWLFDVTGIQSSYSHTIQAVGGYWQANFTINDNQDNIEDWLADGLGRHIEVFNESQEMIWEGFVDEVSANLGALTVSRGMLLDIANRVSVVYTTVDTSTDPPTTGDQSETSVENDTTSQTKYGIIPNK